MNKTSRPFSKFNPRAGAGAPVTRHSSLVTLLILALAGCSTPKLLQGGTSASYFDDNLRYEHPFTDAAFDYVRKDAERECASRKKVALKAPGTCTLDRCVTEYQCISKSDAAEYNNR